MYMASGALRARAKSDVLENGEGAGRRQTKKL